MGLRYWLRGIWSGGLNKEAARLSSLPWQEEMIQRTMPRPKRDRASAIHEAFTARGFKVVEDSSGWPGALTLTPPPGVTPSNIGAIVAEVMAKGLPEGLLEPALEGNRPGIKPPFHRDDAEADRMGWSIWVKTMSEMIDIPGWAPCRFANRTGEERMAWVFGVVRGDFGVWNQPYPVCHHPNDDNDKATFKPNAILSAVTHLPSGMGMGIFHDRATACTACELLDGVEDWRALPQTEDNEPARLRWKLAMANANRTWEFNGINWSLDWHAHNGPGGGELGIWTKSAAFLSEGRPEKLS